VAQETETACKLRLVFLVVLGGFTQKSSVSFWVCTRYLNTGSLGTKHNAE